MMFTSSVSDRRKDYRIYNPVPVACEIVNTQGTPIRKLTVMAKDISSSGIYFEFGVALALNTEMKVEFSLPRTNHNIIATVKIKRIESTELENTFGIGAAFTEIQDNDRHEIVKFIEFLNIEKLLEITVRKGASDLHLLAEQQPALRIHGEIEPIDLPKLSSDEISKILFSTLSRQQIKQFEHEKELDYGLQFDSENRFRVNLHQQRGFTEATLRLINTRIPSFEELQLPDAVKDLARLKDGLILVAGPTGSGKTTTIAAMVDLINKEKKGVVITLERPIEFVHLNIKSIIKQREVGIDTNSFSTALKSSLRQDPNVIVIGEIEDIETVKTAIIAAETGHLVIASFHATDSMQAIDRLAGFFPTENRKQILSQLSHCLHGILTQVLLPRKDKLGRVLACEIVFANDAVKRIIRRDELIQLATAIQTGANFKMKSLNDAVKKYLDEGVIDEEAARAYLDEANKSY